VPASSTQACLHLLSLHDVYEHVRGDDVLPSFCGCDCDHGKSVCAHGHVLRHICDHRVCGHGCDPRCISRSLLYKYNVKNTK